jgi:hypothetical protein
VHLPVTALIESFSQLAPGQSRLLVQHPEVFWHVLSSAQNMHGLTARQLLLSLHCLQILFTQNSL